jgi:SAM-dependent methyltransferase
MIADGLDNVTAWFDRAAPAYGDGVFARLVKAWEARAVFAVTGPVPSPVLELGCGAGDYTRRLLAAGAREVVAVDRSLAMLDRARGDGVRTILSDAAHLSLSETFPLVFSAGMLEFVPDPTAVFAVAAAHAQPDAALVMFVPVVGVAGERYRAWHASHGVVVQLFDERALEGLGAAWGWRLVATRRVWPFGLAARFCRSFLNISSED